MTKDNIGFEVEVMTLENCGKVDSVINDYIYLSRSFNVFPSTHKNDIIRRLKFALSKTLLEKVISRVNIYIYKFDLQGNKHEHKMFQITRDEGKVEHYMFSKKENKYIYTGKIEYNSVDEFTTYLYNYLKSIMKFTSVY